MIAPTIGEFEARNATVFTILARIENEFGIPILMPSNILCDEALCIVALEDGRALYHDDDHLSTVGARYISEIFDAALSR